MAELPDDVHERIQAYCAEGDELADGKRYDAAIDRYTAAWNQLPEPRSDWDAALWILTAMGDAQFHAGKWAPARLALMAAARDCGGVDNPFVRLRLGQVLFEEGDLDEAANWLAPAFLSEGSNLFANEDPKYLAFLKSKLSPPPGGWPKGW
jgi:tetratricopeptide (TPR) repeat protein